ncbi:2-polyprenyl-6-hydroxyphenyl methylase / 3-demethylubiquinone-9 3-methyltransferase [Actinokineospora diospyrosa]|uniref:2-polyprenyl-6-hydroxyphenyl methylase / 3-demethylubiquinone-9 3-methyltransferase n=1 Tax=Actinokineospora diospyrosa TaxID=103728 RepID=A0ABT1I695_9PSEU|nr:2-polyprenyl-6-hydroxyphenyl methylase / 3-demethylubiquinone-9 3-methyltransferase [Actinokineospora diospyrosa]
MRGYSGDEVAGYLRDPYHRLRLRHALDMLTEHLPAGAVVADLGAGGGEVGDLLGRRGLRPVACDVVAEACRAALRAGVAAVRLDVGALLPVRTGSLDGVLAGEIIEHVYDPALLLAECHRVLRPGGILVLTTPNLAPAQDRLRFLLGQAPRQVDPFHEYLHLHIRPFTYPLLATGLRAAGFAPSPPRSNHVVWRTRRREFRSRWAARRWPTLGGSLVVAGVRLA